MIVKDIVYKTNSSLETFGDVDIKFDTVVSTSVIDKGKVRNLVGVWVLPDGSLKTLDSLTEPHKLSGIKRPQVVDNSSLELNYNPDKPFLNFNRDNQPSYYIILNSHELGNLLDMGPQDRLLYCKLAVNGPQNVVDTYKKV